MNVLHLLLAGAGGCIGSMARYAAVVSIDKKFNAIFPYGTLTVNIAGSFILGAVLAWATRKTGMHHGEWRVLLGTGFCGGFTTFSAFAAENMNLFEQKFPATALVYILVSVASGLVAVWAGFALARNIF